MAWVSLQMRRGRLGCHRRALLTLVPQAPQVTFGRSMLTTESGQEPDIRYTLRNIFMPDADQCF